MLSISAMAAGKEKYYLAVARDDSLENGEPLGTWFGGGANELGLGLLDYERVDDETLTLLMRGVGPDGEPLRQRQKYDDGRQQVAGFDLTFSAPKSVSVLWGLADDEARRGIELAQLDAVKTTLQFVEDELAASGRGAGAAREEPGRVVVALFPHFTSRAGDPGIHTHALLLNAVFGEDRKWGALRAGDLFRFKMALGALFRVQLAWNLSSRLGLALQATRTWFEVPGVPSELLAVFSRRRAQLLQAAQESGAQGPVALEFLAKTTRTKKRSVSGAALREEWHATARAHGVSVERVRALIGGRTKQRSPAQQDGIVRRAVARAIRDLEKTESVFFERDLLQRTAELVQAAGVPLQAVRRAVGESLAHAKGVVPLHEVDGVRLFASRSLFQLEAKLLRAVSRPLPRVPHLVGVLSVELASRGLTDEQCAALKHVTADTGWIQCVSAGAGTDTPSVLRAASRVWETAGYDVRGAAVSGSVAQALEDETGIRSYSLRGLHMSFMGRALSRQTVLVIDAAETLGTRECLKLVAAARRARAKLVLVGDESRRGCVEAGSPFVTIARKLGAATLTENVRQRQPWMREAVDLLSEGYAKEALSLYAAHGRLRIARLERDARGELVSTWFDQRTRDLSQTAILVGTRLEAREVNHQVQNERWKRGELLLMRSVVGADGTRFHVGDRVQLTRNILGLAARNGALGTVEEVRPAGRFHGPRVAVRFDRRQPVIRYGLLSYVKRSVRTSFVVDKKSPLALGYALTTARARGPAWERTFVLAGGWLQDRELSYAQMSSAVGDTFIFAARKDVAGDRALLSSLMNRTRPRVMAHELLERHAQGLQP